VLMMSDAERGPWIITTVVLGVPALIGGWFLVRNRVTAAADRVSDHAGEVPDDLPPEPANPATGA
jgi:L-asparagine permease